MIDLIQISNITDDLIQEFKLKKEDLLYVCHLENKKIGYAIIRAEINNRIFLIIAKEYQGKGYGNIIFNHLLSKMDKPVICTVPFENIKMQRIIQNHNGIEIERNGKSIQYMIK